MAFRMKNPGMVTDEQLLVGEFRQGNTKAYKIIFDKYFAAIRYFAKDLVRDDDDAKDLAQGAFIALWNKQGDFENLRAIKAFLYISTRNACLNHLRRAKMIKQHQRDSVPALLQEELKNETMGMIFEAETLREIYAIVHKLPTQCRRVMLLELQGIPTDTIASMLELAPQTVRNHKVRAIDMLGKKFVADPKALAVLAALFNTALVISA